MIVVPGDGVTAVLVPVADLCNHTDNEAECQYTIWDSEKRQVRMHAAGDISAGKNSLSVLFALCCLHC